MLALLLQLPSVLFSQRKNLLPRVSQSLRCLISLSEPWRRPQYRLQSLSKLSDMAANYLCFSFLVICSPPRILAISLRDSFIIFNGCWRGPAFHKPFKKPNTTYLKVLGCPCEKVNFH